MVPLLLIAYGGAFALNCILLVNGLVQPTNERSVHETAYERTLREQTLGEISRERLRRHRPRKQWPVELHRKRDARQGYCARRPAWHVRLWIFVARVFCLFARRARVRGRLCVCVCVCVCVV